MASRLKTQGINGTSIFVISAGAIILISGITNKHISDVVHGFLKGQTPKPDITPATDTSTTAIGSGGEHSGTSTAAGGVPSVNRTIGKLMAAPFGWSVGPQWDALDKLLTRESGWQNDIANRESGAFGIGQALGHGVPGAAAMTHVRYPGGGTAYISVNEYPNILANSGNAGAQIAWTYAYIKSRYGDPITAWQHEEANSWY